MIPNKSKFKCRKLISMKLLNYKMGIFKTKKLSSNKIKCFSKQLKKGMSKS